jgi:uncharacterized protein (DUF2236 family)
VETVPQVNAFERHRADARARVRATSLTRAGSGSVTWKINREMIVIAGWGRAILLQLAHPSIAAGLNDHSSFRGSLLSGVRRMRSTVGAMLSIAFGDPEEMIAAAARISTIHDRVRGRVAAAVTDRRRDRRSGDSGSGETGSEERASSCSPVPPAIGDGGKTYSAHDPALQRWVHATLLESIPLTYEVLVGPLTDRERDQYCLEAAFMEPLLGMPDRSLPRDIAQLETYMREMLAGGHLVVTDTSRALARAVLYPPRWYVAWPAFRALQLLTIGSLPPSIREAYGFEWRARDARAFARWTTTIRTALRLVPPMARHWPKARRPASRAQPVMDACSAGVKLLS